MNIFPNYPRHFFAAQMVASAERGEPQACDRVDWQLDLRSWSFPFAQREIYHPPQAFLMHVFTFFLITFFQAANGSYIPMCYFSSLGRSTKSLLLVLCQKRSWTSGIVVARTDCQEENGGRFA